MKSSVPADRFLKPLVVLLIVLLASPEVFAVVELTTLLELVGATLFLLMFSAAFKLLALSVLDWLRRAFLPIEYTAMIGMSPWRGAAAAGFCLIVVNGLIRIVVSLISLVILWHVLTGT